METIEEIQMLSFTIILHAGNARSHAMAAISLAKDYNFTEARNKIEEANVEFVEAHRFQSKLIQAEARGIMNEVTVILVHAQDHLMMAMTVKDLANEMIYMYEKMKMIEERVK